MRIIALDPGGATGWCTHTLFLDPIRTSNVDISKSITYGELTGEHHNELWQLLYEFNPDVIVYERFEYQIRTTKSGSDRQQVVLDSKEYIGVLKLWGQQHLGKCTLVEQQQMKGNASSQWSDEKLQKLGVYVPAMGHSNDAKRQLLSYIVFGKPQRQDYLRLLKRQ